MKWTAVGKRGYLFYNDRQEVNYLINGDKKLILCDTSSNGRKQITEINQLITDLDIGHKERLIFNSHADYDHIWGNHYFKATTIISSQACLADMEEKALFEAHVYQDLAVEPIELTYPNLTFNKSLTLVDEGIEFYYTPGHTVGDAICYDLSDQVLYVGDLIESPIPYLGFHNLQKYLKTLNFLKTFDATLINGHNGIVDKQLIDDNIQYVTNVMEQVEITNLSGDSLTLHQHNLKALAILQHEALLKSALLMDKTNYFSDKIDFWEKVKQVLNRKDCQDYDLSSISLSQLKELLKLDYQEKMDKLQGV